MEDESVINELVRYEVHDDYDDKLSKAEKYLRAMKNIDNRENVEYELIEETDDTGKVYAIIVNEIVNNNKKDNSYDDYNYMDLKRGEYYTYGEQYYVIFHYRDRDTEKRVYDTLIEEIAKYGCSDNSEDDEYIIPDFGRGKVVKSAAISDSLLFVIRSFVEKINIPLRIGDSLFTREMNVSDYVSAITELEVEKKPYGEDIKYTLYRDGDKYYASKDMLDQFSISPDKDPIIVDGIKCYYIPPDTVDYLMDHIKNIEKEKIKIKPINLKKVAKKSEVKKEGKKAKDFTLYRYDDNGNIKILAKEILLKEFNIEPSGKPKLVRGIKCYVLTSEQLDKFKDIAKKKYGNIAILYKNIYSNKKESEQTKEKKEEQDNKKEESEGHNLDLVGVLHKITEGLRITPRALEQYKASNVKVSSMARDIFTNNWEFSIKTVIDGIIEMAIAAIKKLTAKIFLSEDEIVDIKELERRLYEDLTEEELDTILNEYPTSEIRKKINPQINDFIVERMRSYILEVVMDKDDYIQLTYNHLLNYLEEIKHTVEAMDGDLDNHERDGCVSKKKKLLKMAASTASIIDKCRSEGLKLLSNNGLYIYSVNEIKDIINLIPYMGRSYINKSKFLGVDKVSFLRHEAEFTEAVDERDDEKTVRSFIDLESCYLSDIDDDYYDSDDLDYVSRLEEYRDLLNIGSEYSSSVRYRR